MKFYKELLSFFLPPFCAGCNKRLPSSQNKICKNCITNLILVDKQILSIEFERKFNEDKILKDFFAAYIFEANSTIQDIVHAVKYTRKFGSALLLGELTANQFLKQNESWNADLILPVPLHTMKKAERGFNQAYFIAKGISRILNIKSKTGIIKRVKFTETQTKLNFKERKQNIENAFVLKRKNKIKNKNIILVDDVITTGATISECARVLKKNGAANIYGISAAIADFNFTSVQERLSQE